MKREYIMHDNLDKYNKMQEEELTGHNGYESLWRAVLIQVLSDCKTQHKRSSAQIAKRQAINWLNTENEDFRIVCSLANVDHQPDIDLIKQNIGKYSKLLKRRNYA